MVYVREQQTRGRTLHWKPFNDVQGKVTMKENSLHIWTSIEDKTHVICTTNGLENRFVYLY